MDWLNLMRAIAASALICVVIALAASPARSYLDAQAAYRMALRWHYPQPGRARDYGRALHLYCRADGDGHAGAAFAIGLMYAAGEGVKRSDGRAAAWFQRAAALGHDEAKRMLENYRSRGFGARCPNGWGRGGSARAQMQAPNEIRALVEKMAPRFELDPGLVLAVIAVESAFQQDAVSSANAQGLMQLIPATAERFGVRDPFDAEDNLRGGMTYLRWLLDRFKGSVPLALAAYNAGENTVTKYGGIPPYAETQTYVRRIRRLYDKRTHP